MKIDRKRFVALLAMALMCVFMTSAVAAGAQPDEAWMAEHLLTSLPAENGAEQLPLADVTARNGSTGLKLEAEPAATLGKGVNCTVTLNLILEGSGDATPTWTLDMAAPLTLNDVKAKAAAKDEEKITPPSDQEIAKLVEIRGLCAHGETAMKLEGVAHTVTAYKDESGVSRAAVTIAPAAVATTASRVLAAPHSPDQINKLKVAYDLAEADGAWTLTGMTVKFGLVCNDEKYTVTYDDGCEGQAFPRERYWAYKGQTMPKCKVDVSNPDAVRAGYRFIGWDKEISATVRGSVTYTAQWIKLHTVAYADGADGAAFATETYIVPDGAATPACTVDVSNPEAVREGYRFAGWDKAISATATGDVTYTAQWAKKHTITYANVPEGVENPNPVTYEDGDTPIALVGLDCEGFAGWVDAEGNIVTEISADMAGDLVLTAKVISRPPYPKVGTNISKGLYTVQCTKHAEHTTTNSAFVELNTSRPTNNDLAWNDTTKRWEVTVKIALNRFVNTTVTRKRDFGDMYHNWYDNKGNVSRSYKPEIKLYWAPDAEGSTSLGDPVTGLWYAVDGNPVVLDVFCYDEPAAPSNEKKLTVGGLWLRNCYNLKNYLKVTSLAAGTYTVGEMTKHDDGKFYVPVTVTPDAAVAAFQAKYGSEYVICDDTATHGEQAASFTFMLKYTGSANDYKQDGTGWRFDEAATIALGTGYVKYNGYVIWMARHFDVTYTDGVEEEVVFEDKVFTVCEGAATPAFDGEPTRTGYRFLGWDPEVAPEVTASATYTAKWEKVYAITYENVPEGVENTNPVAYVAGDTPIALAALDCDGFLGWLDAEGNAITEIAQGTTGDLVIKANIVSRPSYPKDGHNISENLYTIQCTTVESHTRTYNAQLYVNTSRPTNNDMAWNETLKRWEITAEIKFNNFLNSTVTRNKYFGGLNHHWDLGTGADKNPKIRLYWAPDAEGSTSLGDPVTGLWYAVEGNPVVLEVFCYDKPAAPTEEKLAKLSGKFYRIQDFTKNTVYANFTKLKPGTYTIGEVYGNAEEGWKVDLTITDMQAYYADFLAKCTDDGVYVIAAAASNTKNTWTLKYTGKTYDYAQDGTGWTLDKTVGGPNYATRAESLNGRYINFYPTWQTTYTDGVEEEEVFADQAYTSPATIRATAYNKGEDFNVRRNGKGLPTTPFNGDPAAVPARPGYTFTGWEPAWSEYVSANVNYVATWSKDVYTVTYWDGDQEELVFSPQQFECGYGDKTPAFQGTPVREGYIFVGWTPELAETVTGSVEYAAVWKKIVTVTYTDGVEEEEIFADQVYPDLQEGDAMPQFVGDAPTRDGYEFAGWQPELMDTVPAEDVTFVAQWKKYCKVTYTDESGTLTEQVDTVLEGEATPAYTAADVSDPEALREGYRFVGWEPEVSATVTDDVTYAAKWGAYFTITYENVPEGVENTNPTRYNEADPDITLADIDCEGFAGWVNAEGTVITTIPTGTTGDLVLTAKIVGRPAYPKVGHNISEALYTVQCTTNAEHTLTHNAFVSLNTSRPTNNDLAWNAGTKRWEVTVKIELNRFVNTSVTRERDFGDMYHNWYDNNGNVSRTYKPEIKLYWAPDAEGSTSLGDPVTGLWYAVDGNPVTLEVFCYDKPGALKEDKIVSLSGKFYRIQDYTNNTVYAIFNKLKKGTFTIGEMYGNAEEGWKVDVTITDMEPYYAEFLGKCKDDATYLIAQAASNTKNTWTFTYTGSKTDYKQDGSGWTLDKTVGGPNYATKGESLNGRYINFYPTWQTTYTDGVEGEEVFADQVQTSPATIRDEDANARRKGQGLPTTPFNGDPAAVPVRPGYVFTGWEPAWSATVSSHVTYVATWAKAYTVTYSDGVDGAAFETQTYDVIENGATPAFNGEPTREGYDFDGWTPEVAETVTEDVTYVAVWTKLWNVTYTDGVEDEVIFEDQSYTVRDGDATPAYVGAPFAREGFLFKGWSPALAETVTADVTYVAVWTVNDTGLSVPEEPVVKDEPTEPETPVEEPTEPETPVDEPTEPETPVEEPTEPETPVEEPTEPAPVEEPTEPETPVEEPTEPETPVEEPTEPAPVEEPTEPAPVEEPTEPAPVEEPTDPEPPVEEPTEPAPEDEGVTSPTDLP